MKNEFSYWLDDAFEFFFETGLWIPVLLLGVISIFAIAHEPERFTDQYSVQYTVIELGNCTEHECGIKVEDSKGEPSFGEIGSGASVGEVVYKWCGTSTKTGELDCQSWLQKSPQSTWRNDGEDRHIIGNKRDIR